MLLGRLRLSPPRNERLDTSSLRRSASSLSRSTCFFPLALQQLLSRRTATNEGSQPTVIPHPQPLFLLLSPRQPFFLNRKSTQLPTVSFLQTEAPPSLLNLQAEIPSPRCLLLSTSSPAPVIPRQSLNSHHPSTYILLLLPQKQKKKNCSKYLQTPPPLNSKRDLLLLKPNFLSHTCSPPQLQHPFFFTSLNPAAPVFHVKPHASAAETKLPLSHQLTLLPQPKLFSLLPHVVNICCFFFLHHKTCSRKLHLPNRKQQLLPLSLKPQARSPPALLPSKTESQPFSSTIPVFDASVSTSKTEIHCTFLLSSLFSQPRASACSSLLQTNSTCFFYPNRNSHSPLTSLLQPAASTCIHLTHACSRLSPPPSPAEVHKILSSKRLQPT